MACTDSLVCRVSATPEGRCPGCEAVRADVEQCLDGSRVSWDRHSRDNDNHFVIPPAPLIPGSALPADIRGPTFIPTREHCCRQGRLMSTARIWYYPRNLDRLGDPARSLIHFRLHFHLVIPGELVHRWSSSTSFDASFPLFGAVRRYWGRVLRVGGRVNFEGERRSRERRVATELEEVRVRAVVRRGGLLRMSEMTAHTHLQWGPRLDGMLLAMSLQWHSEVDVDELPEGETAREPENCTPEEASLPIHQRIAVPLAWRRLDLGRASSERQAGRLGGIGDAVEDDEGEDRGEEGESLVPPGSGAGGTSRNRRGA